MSLNVDRSAIGAHVRRSALVLSLLVSGLACEKADQRPWPEYPEHISESGGFSIRYPASWRIIATGNSGTVLRLQGPEGQEVGVFMAAPNASLDGISSKRYAHYVYRQLDHAGDRAHFGIPPDAIVTRVRGQYLGLQHAICFDTEFALVHNGIASAMQSHSIATIFDSKEFILTFRGRRGDFALYRDDFGVIERSFRFTSRRDRRQESSSSRVKPEHML
tara:strand:- start:5634 stop:6290 length:657 start_codon:yes stop_codon:yes gene_type:complete